MRALTFSHTALTPDLDVKQAAAEKQMAQLVELLKVAPKYHTLTKNDRQRLKKDGYAPDLVDNLIVMTQNQGVPTSRQDDNIMIGFTYAAFDPALYANSIIKEHFETVSIGCCCFCESFLTPTDGGVISHYRPVQLLDSDSLNLNNGTSNNVDGGQQCSPYFSFAYQQNNLVYSCRACDEKYKAGLFPVVGKRYPEVSVEQEQPLLIHPYHENPRDFIRFNPVNGQAYAYDHVCAFYQATTQLSKQEIETLLWQQPSAIPNQRNSQGLSITAQDVDQNYQDWLQEQKKAHQTIEQSLWQSRGQVTIDTLGLNRVALVLSRLDTLRQLRHENAWINEPPQSTDCLPVNAYRSLAVDAFATWHAQLSSQQSTETSAQLSTKSSIQSPDNLADSKDQLVSQPIAGIEGNDVEVIDANVYSNAQSDIRTEFPVWFRSCLVYLVSESELQQTNKRRLVYLSGRDRLYGEKPKEKCVFLPINWQRDSHNLIKVHSHRNIWEASFLELASSRPQELVELFANNDIWVEGAYPALTA
ncbi:hypothetical protein CBF23_008910 [Marinomonas agarivorans]|nr:hypothetical protein CBF23_008910 [Marinomonas agarivorans]